MAEQCPFCMVMVNEGATICAQCGATKVEQHSKSAVFVIYFLAPLVIFVGVVLVMLGLFWRYNMLAWAVIAFAAAFALTKMAGRNSQWKWVRRMG